jgi:uncharacterized protein YceK
VAQAVRIFTKLACCYVCIIALAGCATFKTLDTDLPLNQRMFVYSGTRLDWAAVTKNDAALKRMKVKPPPYPVVDLPFSFGLDSIFLPLSLIAAIFE